jgi:hypothetical protein
MMGRDQMNYWWHTCARSEQCHDHYLCVHTTRAQHHTVSSDLEGMFRIISLLRPDIICAALQYHYRPGTITGWIAGLLDRHADRRRSAPPAASCCRYMPAWVLTLSPQRGAAVLQALRECSIARQPRPACHQKQCR